MSRYLATWVREGADYVEVCFNCEYELHECAECGTEVECGVIKCEDCEVICNGLG